MREGNAKPEDTKKEGDAKPVPAKPEDTKKGEIAKNETTTHTKKDEGKPTAVLPISKHGGKSNRYTKKRKHSKQ